VGSSDVILIVTFGRVVRRGPDGPPLGPDEDSAPCVLDLSRCWATGSIAWVPAGPPDRPARRWEARWGCGRARRYPAVLVGTPKRERQKANRQQRLEEIARQQRKEKTKRRGLLIAGVVVGGVALLFLLAKVFGGSDDSTGTDTSTVTTVDPTATTLDPASTTTLDPSATTTEAPTTTEGTTTTEGPTTTVAEDFAYGTADCPKDDGSSAKPDSFDGAPKLCIDPEKTYTAEVVTNKGSFTITLDAERSPGNVNNFVTLSRYHYYDGTGCHRVIADFVVQCGRPGEDETAPGYTIPDELPTAGDYEIGMVVMANTGSPDTGGGQWFVITGEQGASLPPQYSIIGSVTTGLDSTIKALANLADPTTDNGVPPLAPIEIDSITISES
jgi:cyclophilin family peptidyl-prolyl cis-trans isomerase